MYYLDTRVLYFLLILKRSLKSFNPSKVFIKEYQKMGKQKALGRAPHPSFCSKIPSYDKVPVS